MRNTHGWQRIAVLLTLFALLSGCGSKSEPMESTESAAASLATETSAPAEETPVLNGWVNIDGIDYYYIDGTPAAGLQTISDIRYYFDTAGKPVTGKVLIDGILYIFGNDGKGINGWYEEDGVKYNCANGEARCDDTLDFDSGYYVFDDEGHLTNIVYSEPHAKEMTDLLYFTNSENTKVQASCFVLDEPILNCVTLDIVSMLYSSNSIDPDGIWILALRIDDEWIPVAAYSVNDHIGRTGVWFEEPVCFDAYAVYRNSSGETNPEMTHAITYVSTEYREDNKNSTYKPSVPRHTVWQVVVSDKRTTNMETGANLRTGVFTALDGSGQVLWTYTTDIYEVGQQYSPFGKILLTEDRFFFFDAKGVYCMNANTGAILWHNKELDIVANAHGILHDNGNLYAYCTPLSSFFAVDPYGRTLYSTEDFFDYTWPCDIQIEDEKIALYFEVGPENVDREDWVLYIDPYSYECIPKTLAD